MATQTVTPTSLISGANLLRLTLREDGVFEIIGGLGLIVAASPIASFLGVDAPIALEVLGAILVLSGAFILWAAAQRQINRRATLAIIVGNDAWVAASILILLTGWISFSSEGKWAVGIVAAVVAVFSIVEFFALRRANKL